MPPVSTPASAPSASVPVASDSAAFNRRDLLVGGSALAALISATPYLSRPIMMHAEDFAPLLDSVSDILLPGSLSTQPGAYLASVIPREWRGLTLSYVKTVSHWLNRHAQGDFLSISFERRFAVLTALDTATFDGAAAETGESDAAMDAETAEAWTILKRALLTSFYTSQKGGSGDLAFNLVPGRWDADIPLAQAPRPLSNDWLAIWFS